MAVTDSHLLDLIGVVPVKTPVRIETIINKPLGEVSLAHLLSLTYESGDMPVLEQFDVYLESTADNYL